MIRIRCAQLAGASDEALSKVWRAGESDTATWAADVRRVLSEIAAKPDGELARAWQAASQADCSTAAPARREVKP